jgi:hypothetical protein
MTHRAFQPASLRSARRGWLLAVGQAVLVGVWVVWAGRAGAAGPHYGRGSLEVHEWGVDLNHDGVYDLLRIDAEAQLDEPGKYWVQARLCADTCLSEEEPLWGYGMEDLAAWQVERWPTLHPQPWKQGERSLEAATDKRNRIRFSCWFDGDRLAALNHDGPWHFCPYLQDERGMASAGQHVEELPDCAHYELSAELKPWLRRMFGQWPVMLRNVDWRIMQPGAVALDVAVDVQRSGRRDFRVRAVSGTYAADSTISRVCRVGADTLVVTLALHDSLGAVPDSLTAAALRLEVRLPEQAGGTHESTWTHPPAPSPWHEWCHVK